MRIKTPEAGRRQNHEAGPLKEGVPRETDTPPLLLVGFHLWSENAGKTRKKSVPVLRAAEMY